MHHHYNNTRKPHFNNNKSGKSSYREYQRDGYYAQRSRYVVLYSNDSPFFGDIIEKQKKSYTPMTATQSFHSMHLDVKDPLTYFYF